MELIAKHRNQERKWGSEEEDKGFCQINGRQTKTKRKKETPKQSWDNRALQISRQILSWSCISVLIFFFISCIFLIFVISCHFIQPVWQVYGHLSYWMQPTVFYSDSLLDYKVCILPALLVCTPAGNGTELIFFLLHLWPSFRPFLVFLAICLTSRVACILTRQSGSPSFRTTSEVPTQSRPDTPSKIPLRGCSKPRTKPGVVPKIHHYILAWVSLPYLAS